ncbi:monovalent cation/H(+) antiporter subunit G [Agathobaculum sp. NTUH-O15-33]|uniref:monovalent cation/H(+) antiporter subunit G n=1 Tax=Agathobaculum sp. NTUH-O15-33 TaxID=3079302 RepID=UPI0029583588|nr:monovalent cation/H(+) antiporter subunit G [Agathobaculum sp. NTUH-O15-33]WNX85148.1 monovalent cation/H(+) antiporter subunit G [Agathobaculum sp. NTUH-O15-33]
MLLLGNLVLALGLVIIACGMIGLIRARGFYRRLLAGALVDTAGLLVLLLGVLLRQGLTPFSLKIALLMGAVLLTAPLITHKLGRSAYLSGHREEVQEHVE